MRSDQKGFKVDERVLSGAGDVEPTFVNRFDSPMGSSTSGKERDRLFLNCFAEEERFVDISGVSGLDTLTDSRAFAWFDFDRDGWLDIAHVSANAPKLQLFHNRVGRKLPSTRAFIALDFRGGNTTSGPSEYGPRDGYGALVTVELEHTTLVREYRCGEGLAAQNSATMMIGIGDSERVKAVHVRWPSGKTSVAHDLAAGSRLTVYENPADGPQGEAIEVRAYPPRIDTAPVAALPPLCAERLELVALEPETAPRLTMVTTMATWCQSCLGELPELEHLRGEFPASDLRMVAIPIDANDTPEVLGEYVETHEPVYELLVNRSPEQVERVNAIQAQVLRGDGTPATFLCDDTGQVVFAKWGAPSVSEIRRLLRALPAH